jgi:hypothetical protein
MGDTASGGRADRLVQAQWLLVGALVGLAALPTVRARIPGMAAVWGPVGWAAATGALLAIAPGRRPVLAALTRLPTWVVFLTTVAIAAPVGLFYVSRTLATGDEPHYLIMARSLWQEGDLDVVDNMARGDYKDFSYGFQFHYGRPTRDGRPYPAHGPGLPVLLAPFLALGGRRACVALLALLLGLLGATVPRLARKCGADREGALLAWAAAVGPPTFFFAVQIYTELPSALALTLALNLLLAGRPGPGRALVAALVTATLPWLHVKLVLAALALGLVGLVRLESRARWAFVMTGTLMAVLFVAHHWWIFGSPFAAGYGSFPPRGFRHSHPLAALVGLGIDREFGLLVYAPIFLLALPGTLLALGSYRRRAWPLLVVAMAVLVPILPWRMWWAGQSPPARFLVPLLPMLAVTMGLHGRALRKGLERWALPLLLVGFATAAFMFLGPGGPSVVSTPGAGTSASQALGIGAYLPSLVPGVSATDWRIALVWLVALATLLLLNAAARRSASIDRLFRAPLLPLTGWLAIAAVVDLWVRA